MILKIRLTLNYLLLLLKHFRITTLKSRVKIFFQKDTSSFIKSLQYFRFMLFVFTRCLNKNKNVKKMSTSSIFLTLLPPPAPPPLPSSNGHAITFVTRQTNLKGCPLLPPPVPPPLPASYGPAISFVTRQTNLKGCPLLCPSPSPPPPR